MKFRDVSISLAAASARPNTSHAAAAPKSTRPRRPYGTGQLYIKHGDWYGRWRSPNGKRLNRRIGAVKTSSEPDGLTRKAAEREFAKLRLAVNAAQTRPARDIAAAAAAVRRTLEINGASLSHIEGCASMLRVHIAPVLGSVPIDEITRDHVEEVVARMAVKGLAPKTIRQVLSHLATILDYAVSSGWTHYNPARLVRPPRHHGVPVIRFLTPEEVDRVVDVIPNAVRLPARASNGRWPGGSTLRRLSDHYPPVLRPLVLAAAMTGMRQSELLGVRWGDVDLRAQRIRVRTPHVRRGTSNGKSAASARRSIPMPDRLAETLEEWRTYSLWAAPNDHAFAHPVLGRPLDGAKVTRRFKEACVTAGVEPVRFHDLRHGYATQLARRGVPLRTIAEFMGHADLSTTQIYAHYARDEREVELVNDAFGPRR